MRGGFRHNPVLWLLYESFCNTGILPSLLPYQDCSCSILSLISASRFIVFSKFLMRWVFISSILICVNIPQPHLFKHPCPTGNPYISWKLNGHASNPLQDSLSLPGQRLTPVFGHSISQFSQAQVLHELCLTMKQPLNIVKLPTKLEYFSRHL